MMMGHTAPFAEETFLWPANKGGIMFLQIVKNQRANLFKYRLVSKEEIKKIHPYHMELRAWLYGPKMGSRFGLTSKESQFIYVRTDETADDNLKQIAMRH
jgi:hypothetical protein